MRSRRSRIFGLIGVFAFAILVAGGAALFANSRAQAVPPQCQYLVANNSGSTDLAAPGQSADPTKPANPTDPTDPTDPTTDPTVIPANATIQSVTDAQCQALPVYDGTNEDAIHVVTDTRGGTTRTYRISKLADNHCWMLDNLKLGSITSSISLTPADSNITSNFTLPKLYGGDGSDWNDTYKVANPGDTDDEHSYDYPRAFGPVPGGTSSGATNYGYLYNFSAATAGETRTSLPATGGDAQGSICPANWKLPSGGNTTSDFANLDIAFGGTGYYAYSNEPNIAKWQNGGPFKGVFSGYWYFGFYDQGSRIYLWSRSSDPNWDGYTMYTYFGSGNVSPGGSYRSRSDGLAVRCLLD